MFVIGSLLLFLPRLLKVMLFSEMRVSERRMKAKMHSSEHRVLPAAPFGVHELTVNCNPLDDLLRARASKCASTTFGVYAQQ